MTDFWEIIGRMIASKTLRTAMVSDAVLTNVTKTPVTGGFRYPVAVQQHFRSFVRNHIPNLQHLPVSLMTTGEFVRVLGMPTLPADLDALEDRATNGLGVNLQNRSPRFYACLGALTVDDEFAGLVATGGPNAVFGGIVDPQEVTDLVRIADDNQAAGAYSSLAVALCGRSWQPDCLVRLEAYAGGSDIGHPIL